MEIKNNSILVLTVLVIVFTFVGLGCINASDVNSDTIGDVANDGSLNPAVPAPYSYEGYNFVMSGQFNLGSGYHWEISPETHGVDLISQEIAIDNPDMLGSSATNFFTFHVNSDDYYVKLVLISPNGDIAQEIDSNMIN